MGENIVDRLTRGDVILLDGGTGSELQRRGVEVLHGAPGARRLSAWSALANIEAADVVRQVHTDYLRVGADAIISNSFWTGPTRMARSVWPTTGSATPAPPGRTPSPPATRPTRTRTS